MSYEWPPDVLHYEVKLMWGLGAPDLMLMAVAIMVGFQVAGLLGGGLAASVSFLLIKKWAALGQRSFLVWAGYWLYYRWQPQAVVMPLVLPPANEHLSVVSWDNEELFEVGAGGAA